MKVDIKRGIRRTLVSAVLFVAGVSYVPYLWCSRGAGAWYRGDVETQRELARGVEVWVSQGLTRDSFHTGSRQFDGEWLFGTYLMAGLGFVQIAKEHPGVPGGAAEPTRNATLSVAGGDSGYYTRMGAAEDSGYYTRMGAAEDSGYYTRMARLCIEKLMSDDVRSFDREMWAGDPIDSLASGGDHAAYLGYFNLLLGLYRELDPQAGAMPLNGPSPLSSPMKGEGMAVAELNDRITEALVRRIERSPISLLESYPNEVYPVDNCAVIASIAVHARVTGTDRREFLARFHGLLKSKYVDPRSGLLIQAATPKTGEAADAPRGSGTSLAIYFLSFSDKAFSAELYRAARRELAGTVFGFGGIKEYPVSVRDEGGDIDSGPVVFGFGLSPTGFLIGGSRIHRDRDLFGRLYATAYAIGAPYRHDGRMNFVTGASLGDAILFAMLTAGGKEEGL